jgi:hypothetical protein
VPSLALTSVVALYTAWESLKGSEQFTEK